MFGLDKLVGGITDAVSGLGKQFGLELDLDFETLTRLGIGIATGNPWGGILDVVDGEGDELYNLYRQVMPFADLLSGDVSGILGGQMFSGDLEGLLGQFGTQYAANSFGQSTGYDTDFLSGLSFLSNAAANDEQAATDFLRQLAV